MSDFGLKQYKNEFLIRCIVYIVITIIAILIPLPFIKIKDIFGVFLINYSEIVGTLILVFLLFFIYHLIKKHYKLYKPYFIICPICILFLGLCFFYWLLY